MLKLFPVFLFYRQKESQKKDSALEQVWYKKDSVQILTLSPSGHATHLL